MSISDNSNRTNKNIVWPMSLFSEIIKRFGNSVEKTDENDVGELNINKLIENLVEIFSKKLSSSQRKNLSQKLKVDLCQQKLTLTELADKLEPCWKECIDLEEFNIKPQVPIGIKNIVKQYENYISLRGVDLNVMFVGRSGAGKSTLINTIFGGPVSRRNHVVDLTSAELNYTTLTSEVSSIRHIIEEDDFRIRLCIYDTIGFGDLIDNTLCYKSIVTKIKQLYDMHLKKDCETDRDLLRIDERIHCCIYLIPPTGHCLSQLDIKCLKELNGIVNIIPVISRADSLSSDELLSFKSRIRKNLKENEINIFPEVRYQVFPNDFDDNIFEQIANSMPLAVIGASSTRKSSEKLVRSNVYSEIEVFDPSLCDNYILRDLLIQQHLLTLVRTTDRIFFEKHRKFARKELN